MGAQLGSKAGFSDINMTPLIDIVLVVLIIMMVNIPIQIETLGLKLPTPDPPPTPPDQPADQLMIAVYEDGTLALNRRLMTEQQLFDQVSLRLRAADPKNVFIDAAPKASYGRVVDMMDLAKEAGAVKVGVTKMKDSGPAPVTSVEAGSTPRGMRIGTPTVVGSMTHEAADNAIQPHKASMEQCFYSGLGRNPQMNGRVLAQVGVGPQGEILTHSIANSALEDSAVEECIDQVLTKIRFSPLGGQTTAAVQYPLLFSPG